jgi:hypothetical protein
VMSSICSSLNSSSSSSLIVASQSELLPFSTTSSHASLDDPGNISKFQNLEISIWKLPMWALYRYLPYF